MQAQTGGIEGDDNNVSASETFSDAVEEVIDDEASQQYTGNLPDFEEEAFDMMYQACTPYRCTSLCKANHP